MVVFSFQWVNTVPSLHTSINNSYTSMCVFEPYHLSNDLTAFLMQKIPRGWFGSSSTAIYLKYSAANSVMSTTLKLEGVGIHDHGQKKGTEPSAHPPVDTNLLMWPKWGVSAWRTVRQSLSVTRYDVTAPAVTIIQYSRFYQKVRIFQDRQTKT